jgi:DNA modification methylase
MDIIRTREVDLVLTGPPYFSAQTEEKLRGLKVTPELLAEVREELASFAVSLLPVFTEIGRVLASTGVLVLQTKDIRLGYARLRLAEIHREMAEAQGLNLITEIFWHKVSTRTRSSAFRKNAEVGAFRADDMERFLVFSRCDIPRRKGCRPELDDDEIDACLRPVWTFPPLGNSRTHPHQTPPGLARRFVALYSAPGDLVVDPFAGHATMLRQALLMDRRTVGYEINSDYASYSTETLRRQTGEGYV